MNDCIFCKIVAGEIPSNRVYEDERPPEVNLAQRLVHEAAEHLGEPEVGPREDAKGRADRHRVVEVRNDEVGVVQGEVDGHGGKGLAKAMVGHLQEHPELQGLRRWMLATRDAHGLYESLGWQSLPDPSLFMQRHFPDIYA